ncbi:MAG: hypothetical protein V8R01_01260 [Bacilli bacterium]
MANKNMRKKLVYNLTKLLGLALKRYDVPDHEARGYMFQMFFLYARAIDDYADGDVILDSNLSMAQSQKRTLEFLNQKLEFIKSYRAGVRPCDELDELIGIALGISDSLDIPLGEHLEKLFITFNFDLERRRLSLAGDLHLYSKEELVFNSFEMFLQSCYLPLLQTIGSSDEEMNKIRALCYANRIYYNAQDLPGDLREGMINISFEDFEDFEISKDDLFFVSSLPSKTFSEDPSIMKFGVSEGMWQWFQNYIDNGYGYLRDYEGDSCVNSTQELVKNFVEKDNLQDFVFYISLQHGTKRYFKNLSL